jgi:hypothetical protein
MAWIPPGSPLRLGVRSRLIVAQAFFGLSEKRAQRPVLRIVSSSMDLRSVRNGNRRQTLRGWSHAKIQRRKDDRCFVLSEAVLVLVIVIVIDVTKLGDSPYAVGLWE